MCLASSHLNALNEVIAKIKKDFESLNKLQSEFDKELSDKYHEIEKSNFNVVQGYKLAKDIQEILQKRRAIKGEHARLNSLISAMNIAKLDDTLSDMKTRLSTIIKKDEQVRSSLNAKVTLDDLEVSL